MTNLFHYYYEDKWILKNQISGFDNSPRPASIFYFIDNLTIINERREFEKDLNAMYLEELDLRKKNTLPLKHRFQVWISKFE